MPKSENRRKGRKTDKVITVQLLVTIIIGLVIAYRELWQDRDKEFREMVMNQLAIVNQKLDEVPKTLINYKEECMNGINEQKEKLTAHLYWHKGQKEK